MLKWIKSKMGITGTERDEDIEDYITDISTQVKSYCHLSELPEELNSFIRRKVLRILQYEDSQGTSSFGDVKSISEGDTSITYLTDKENSFQGVYSLNDTDRTILQEFRRSL